MADNGIAYVLVGSTGTGKSSLINLYTKSKAHVGHGASAGTSLTHMYPHDNGKDIFIDTVGSEDPNGKSDKAIMIDTLRFLQRNTIKNIVVIWTIKADIRESSTLQKQAEYINSFKNIDIWKSTILIVKGAKDVFRLKTYSKGAISASNKYNKSNITIPTITYDCIDWWSNEEQKEFNESYGQDMNKNELLKHGYYYSNDVKNLINNTINKLTKSSCKVMFENTKCTKCGIIGDKRCMPEKCHYEMQLNHTGKLNKTRKHTGELIEKVVNCVFNDHHSGYIERYHPAGTTTYYSHKYFLAAEWGHKSHTSYDCCGKSTSHSGCETRYTCCYGSESSKGCEHEKIEIKDKVMSCCQLPEESKCCHAKDTWDCCGKDADDDGCTQLCKQCDKPWNDASFNGCDVYQHETEDV